MEYILGFDTSNYTTSVACYHPKTSTVCHKKQLLPVEQGALGLRQRDALFYHVRALPDLLKETVGEGDTRLVAVCASQQPRRHPDSYMPCFLAGKTLGESLAHVARVPYFGVSHQEGHLAAALFSAGRLDALERPFIAFHVSGGTMELLHVTPDDENILSVRVLGHTLDVSPGQLIDRLGVRLGMPFPAGPHLDKLSRESAAAAFRPVPLKEGCCNLSGLENVVYGMLESGRSPSDTARFLLETIARLLVDMTSFARSKTGNLPVVYSGGVLCNTLIRGRLQETGGGELLFADPEFSADNAAGVAVLGFYLYERQKEGRG